MKRPIHGVLIGKLLIGHLRRLRLRTASHGAPRKKANWRIQNLQSLSAEELIRSRDLKIQNRESAAGQRFSGGRAERARRRARRACRGAFDDSFGPSFLAREERGRLGQSFFSYQ